MDNAKMRQVRLNELTTKKEVLRLVKDSRNIIVVNAERLMDEIMDIQEVDAVQVVRCKDCKHWEEIDKDMMMCAAVSSDPYEAWASEANDYCSLGERKDGEQDDERSGEV